MKRSEMVRVLEEAGYCSVQTNCKRHEMFERDGHKIPLSRGSNTHSRQAARIRSMIRNAPPRTGLQFECADRPTKIEEELARPPENSPSQAVGGVFEEDGYYRIENGEIEPTGEPQDIVRLLFHTVPGAGITTSFLGFSLTSPDAPPALFEVSITDRLNQSNTTTLVAYKNLDQAEGGHREVVRRMKSDLERLYGGPEQRAAAVADAIKIVEQYNE